MSEVPYNVNKLPCKFSDGHSNSNEAIYCIHSKMYYSYTVLHSVHALQWNQTAYIFTRP